MHKNNIYKDQWESAMKYKHRKVSSSMLCKSMMSLVIEHMNEFQSFISPSLHYTFDQHQFH